jgi:hypothetical protein
VRHEHDRRDPGAGRIGRHRGGGVPVLAHTAMRAPLATAWEMATVIPASLNDAVGFMPRCKVLDPDRVGVIGAGLGREERHVVLTQRGNGLAGNGRQQLAVAPDAAAIERIVRAATQAKDLAQRSGIERRRREFKGQQAVARNAKQRAIGRRRAAFAAIQSHLHAVRPTPGFLL